MTWGSICQTHTFPSNYGWLILIWTTPPKKMFINRKLFVESVFHPTLRWGPRSASSGNNAVLDSLSPELTCFHLFHMCHWENTWGQREGTLSKPPPPLCFMAPRFFKVQGRWHWSVLNLYRFSNVKADDEGHKSLMELNAFQTPRPTQSRNPLQLDLTYHHAQLIHFLKASHWWQM